MRVDRIYKKWTRGQHTIYAGTDCTPCRISMSMNYFTSRPAASLRGRLRHPNFGGLEDLAERSDRLMQKDHASRQQYDEPSDEKRSHLEEHFFAANADSYHQESARVHPPRGTAAAQRLTIVRCVRQSVYTHVHPRIGHWYPLNPALVQLAKGHFGVKRNGVKVYREVEDVILVYRRRWWGRLILHEAFRQLAVRILHCPLT